jgi:non-ribosomal peptide synthetase component F
VEYWRAQLAGEFPQLQLPFDRAKVSGPFRSSAVERFELSPSLTGRLKQLGAESGCPSYASLLASVAVLLHRYSGLAEVTIGARNNWGEPHEFGGGPEPDGNLLALRIDLSGEPSFQKLQSRVHAALMDAAAHGSAAFAEVLDEIRANQDSESHSPFTIAVSQVFGDASAAKSAGGGPFILDLNFSFQDRGEQLSATIEYAADLFDRSTIAGMAAHWRNLLAGACENPGKPVSQLPILEEAERNRMVLEWNRTGVEYPNECVHQLFERQAAKTPELAAVEYQGQTLTYRELNKRANQLAHYLQKRGVGPDTLVGVCLNRTPEMVIAFLGIWKAGGAYVPLDPSYPQDRLAYMMSDSADKFVLTAKKLSHLFPVAGAGTILLDSDWDEIAKESAANLAPTSTLTNLAYVMYTSGSTGKPKGAMILHRGLANYLMWAVRAYALEEGGSVPVDSSISFDLTVTSVYPALLAGGSIELLPEAAGAEALLEALRRSGRNLVKITPAHLELLSQAIKPEEAAALAKVFVIGGENLPAESLRLWREFAPQTRLINEYGPTETVVGCCVHEVRT